MDDLTRFWSKVDKSGECWLWTGTCKPLPRPYGFFSVKRKNWVAHRWIYQQLNGPIPLGICICHHCDNPRCVRPDHLFAGTAFDNMRDCASKGRNIMQREPRKSPLIGPHRRQVLGEEHGSAKLTAAQVTEIRALRATGLSKHVLSRQFGVDPSHVLKICARALWKHVP